MEIEFAIIADSVEAINGKLYMLGGGWNQHRATAFPSQLRMGIAVSLLIAWDETNHPHVVRLVVNEAVEGKPVLPEVNAEVEVGRPAGMLPGTVQRAILALNAAFPVKRPGKYEVVVRAGTSEKRVTFDAVFTGAQATVRVSEGEVAN
jgi:hypothetical protein